MNTLLNNKVWNFLFTVIFFSLTIIAWKCLDVYHINLSEIKFYDLFIIGLATFRLTRLLIYDEVFYYVKDFVKKYQTEEGFIKSASILLTCPWCISVWMALLSVFVYVLVPYGKFILIILTLSALSNFFHLLITWLGWLTDEKKISVKNQKKKTDNDVEVV
jgi:hypothetical protein